MSNIIRKRIFACLLAATVAASAMLSGCNVFQKDSGNEGSQGSASSQTSQASQLERTLTGDIVAKSDHYSIVKPIMSYLFNNYYAQYGQYAATYYGMDLSKPLKEQYYNQEQGTTWYDYFMQMTTQYVEQLLIMCEAARADGLELEDSDLENVKTSMDSIKSSAESAGMEYDAYLVKYFGEGITNEQIEEYLKMTALAQKYYNKLYTGYTYTDEQYEKCYEENKTSYQYADFLRYSFTFATSTTSDSSEVSVDQDQKDKAKAYAEDLAKCKTEKEFEEYLTTYLSEHPELVTVEESSQQASAADTSKTEDASGTEETTEEESSEQEVTEDQLSEAIEAEVAKTKTTKYAYEVTSEAGSWLFDESRKNNETTVLENTDSYTVLMVTKTAYRDETTTKDVRHILFKPEDYGSSDEEAEKKATEVYELWKKGDATEDSFAELATEYTGDTGSKAKGGLYEGVVEGQMVTEFNDWVFDEKRKPGDTDIVHTTYGYHIMYFVGEGMPAWKSSVDTVLRKDSYNEDFTSFKEKYQVTLDMAYINTIEEIDFNAESSEQHYESQAESSAAASSAAE